MIIIFWCRSFLYILDLCLLPSCSLSLVVKRPYYNALSVPGRDLWLCSLGPTLCLTAVDTFQDTLLLFQPTPAIALRPLKLNCFMFWGLETICGLTMKCLLSQRPPNSGPTVMVFDGHSMLPINLRDLGLLREGMTYLKINSKIFLALPLLSPSGPHTWMRQFGYWKQSPLERVPCTLLGDK